MQHSYITVEYIHPYRNLIIMGSFVWLHLVGVALQNIVPVPKHLVVMAHHRLVADHILDKVHYALSAIGA